MKIKKLNDLRRFLALQVPSKNGSLRSYLHILANSRRKSDSTPKRS